MEHRRIGKSAIYVSDICMGTMTFGSQTDEAEAHRISTNVWTRVSTFSTPPKAIPCRQTSNGLAGQRTLSAAG